MKLKKYFMRIIKAYFLLITRYINGYIYWRTKKHGKKLREYNRGCGYYINVGFFRHNPIGQIWETKMQSDKIGLYELVDYNCYRDPHDMIENSWWNFIGYKGIKPIHKCSFKEFLVLYEPLTNKYK